jgi:hypothetical protein
MPATTRDLEGLKIISAPNMMPLALDGSHILQPVGEPLSLCSCWEGHRHLTPPLQNLQCQYPSQAWMAMNGMPYDENLLPPPASYQETMAWRSWTL